GEMYLLSVCRPSCLAVLRYCIVISIRLKNASQSQPHYWTMGFFILLSHDSLQMDSCTNDHYGPDCRFQCKCKTGCSASGECQTDGVCKNGYFGYLCQFRDLAFLKTEQDMPILTDNDDQTCISDDTLNRATVSMLTGRFSYFRLVIKEVMHKSLDSISFVLKNADEKVSCERETYNVTIVAHIKDYYCSTATDVTSLELVGAGVSSLCTVNIGGGRNLAIKSKFSLSSVSSYPQTNGEAGVDGFYPTDPTFDSETCFYANGSEDTYDFLVLFKMPVLIDYFILINRRETDSVKYLANLEIITYDAYNGTVMRYTQVGDPSQGNGVYTIKHSSKNVPISMFRLENKTLLQFCEIEAYGECQYGCYGLDCTKICSDKCTDVACEVNGRCRECNDGYFGDTCDQACGRCAKNRFCLKLNGSCFDGCQPGFYPPVCKKECVAGMYGLDCSTPCNSNCPRDCTKDMGQCSKCLAGKYGSNCELDCSPHCVDKSCDAMTGHCTSGCTKGFWDSTCTTSCSNCLEGECDQLNLNCTKGCVEGYEGADCSKALSSSDESLINTYYILIAASCISAVFLLTGLLLRMKPTPVPLIDEH
ncbi:stabilin-2-like isoform X2, partial [Biomphalaria glabrata]